MAKREDKSSVIDLKGLRCGLALWFRRLAWTNPVQANRFHRDDRDVAD